MLGMGGKASRLRDRTRLAHGPVERKELRRIELRDRGAWVKVSSADVWGLVRVPDGWWTTEGWSGVTVTKYDSDWRWTGDTFEADDVALSEEDRVRGIAFDGTNLWLTGTNDVVHEYDTAGNVLSSFDTPGNSLMGITFDNTDLWMVDTNDHSLRRYSTNGDLRQEISMSAFWKTGITFWHGNVYLVDNDHAKVLRLSADDGSILGRIDVSSATNNPHGVWVNGDGTIYVAEEGVGVWRRNNRLATP